ncbi:MAG TPA: ATP-binding cassette domain-containing protein [Solirubrobacteraceae bacterium]|nr:ATP-binding cassette domain-containing protein [Solirubrobacteraceae bacterium]
MNETDAELRDETAAPVSPHAAAAELRAALQGIVTSRSPIVGRLSYARTSVRFTVEGERESTTLFLDRRPPELGGVDEPAEVEILLSAKQAHDFAHGLLPMPSAIVRGQVQARGPARRYLEVDPIIRGLLGTRSGHHDVAEARVNGHGPNATMTAGLNGLQSDLLAIETRDLHKSFGPHQVLRGADLKVPEGVVSVVLGPSGTGKSVLLSHIIGLMRADQGDVVFRGRPLSKMSRSQILALRTEIGVMFQDGALFSTMNLYDNVAFPLRQHTKLNDRQIREVVLERLNTVGLGDATAKMPNELSGGMRKRAGLARALVLDPGVLLCDEPDSGLDPVRTALLGELLLEQHAQIGGTIVVITHNVLLARSISDHISILWQGKVIEADMTEVIMQSSTDFVQQFLKGETRGPLGMD